MGHPHQVQAGVVYLNANHFLVYDKDEKGNLVINEAQAAFPGKTQFAEHGALHGRAALHLQGNMWEMRRGILAADVDAGQPENPGVAVRETLSEERRGRL